MSLNVSKKVMTKKERLVETCREIFKDRGEDAVWTYLQEYAADGEIYDWPGKTCEWWVECFMKDHAEEIRGEAA